MNRRELLLTAGAAAGMTLVKSEASGQSVAGHFEGQLVLKVGDDSRLMQLVKPYAYIDGSGKKWAVPADVLVDGASIPQAFWSITGGPFEGAYRNASVIHDYFCDVRTRPWQDVHRMFYEAMLANKVGLAKAKIMYLAVYYGGPRWSEVVIRNMRIMQQKGASSKGGPEGVKDLGELERVVTGLGVDIAVPHNTETTRSRGADYVITAVERPNVDVFAFEAMIKAMEQKRLDIDGIDTLVEEYRLEI